MDLVTIMVILVVKFPVIWVDKFLREGYKKYIQTSIICQSTWKNSYRWQVLFMPMLERIQTVVFSCNNIFKQSKKVLWNTKLKTYSYKWIFKVHFVEKFVLYRNLSA